MLFHAILEPQNSSTNEVTDEEISTIRVRVRVRGGGGVRVRPGRIFFFCLGGGWFGFGFGFGGGGSGSGSGSGSFFFFFLGGGGVRVRVRVRPGLLMGNWDLPNLVISRTRNSRVAQEPNRNWKPELLKPFFPNGK